MLNNVVLALVSRANLQVLQPAHLLLHLSPQVLEQHVTAEVGLEAGLGIRLRHREANLAGGAEVNTPQVGGGGRAAQTLQVGGSAGWPGYRNKDSCGGTKNISDRYARYRM